MTLARYPSTWDRLMYSMSLVTMSVALLLLGTVLWWLLYPYRGFTEVRQPFPVQHASVAAGGVQEYTVAACYHGQPGAAIVVTRELELQDHISTFPLMAPIEYVLTDTEPPCGVREMALAIPTYIPPGRYVVRYYTQVRVNPLRRISQAFVSMPFLVTR